MRKKLAYFGILSLVCFLYLLSLNQSLFGQTEGQSNSISSQASTLRTQRATLTRLERDVQSKEAEIERLYGNIENYQNQIEDLCPGFTEVNRCPSNVQARVADFREEQQVFDDWANELEGEIAELGDLGGINFIRLSEAREALQNEIRTRKLTDDFFDLRLNLEEADEVLDSIEEVYDRSLMGQYFQNKIAQLLNSRSFCSARSRCLNRGDAIPHEDIQRELFPRGPQRGGIRQLRYKRNTEEGDR